MAGAPRDRSGISHMTNVPLARLRVPPSPEAYCLRCLGCGMEPAIADDDLVVAEPTQIPKAGDVVVIWPADKGARPYIRHLLAAADRRRSILLGLFKIEQVIELPLAEVDAVHVVIGMFKPDEVTRTPVKRPALAAV